MTHRLQSQPGFALPLLLILLTFGAVGSMAAVSVAMQQARTTSILNASIQAIHAAESGGAYMVAAGTIPSLPDGEYEGEALAGLSQAFPTAEPGWPMGSGRWWVERLVVAGQTVTFRVIGEDAAGRTSRRIEITYSRDQTTQLFPFETAVLGCSGVDLRGSGLIDSWDSRNGRYGGSNSGANANVSILEGNVTLPGSTRIRGNLHANGNVTFSGSSAVEGSIWAVGNINFSGNPKCPTEELLAGGVITTPGAWWENGCASQWPFAQEHADVPPPSGTCDPLGVDQFVDDPIQEMAGQTGPPQSGDFGGWRPDPVSVTDDTHFSDRLRVGATNAVNFDAETVNNVYVNGNFELTGSGSVRIQAPRSPGADPVVRFYVNGDLDFGGGAQFIIEPGAAVEIYVNGTTKLGAGLRNQNEAPAMFVGDNATSTFSIFSSYEGSNGVTVSGSADIFASIYAPRSDIAVSGSGDLFGAIRGRSLSVTGGAGIHFDETLGGVSSGSTSVAGAARIQFWNEV